MKTAIILAAMLVAAPAMAESPMAWPKTPKEARTYVDSMPAEAWTRIAAASVSLGFFVGKPVVAIFNPFDEPLVNVVCDSKWSLVGANAYNKDKGAPMQIPSHRIAFIPTDSFDGYCKTSIIGLTEDGERHDGVLNIPGDFTNSTAIFFAPAK